MSWLQETKPLRTETDIPFWVRDSQYPVKTGIYTRWEEAEEINQNLLRGSKAIADRVDVGMIGLKTRLIDDSTVDAFVQAGLPRPNYVIHFYKIRRGKLAGTKMWCDADLSTCRIKGLFMTDYNDQPIPVAGTDIKVVQAQKDARKKQATSAF